MYYTKCIHIKKRTSIFHFNNNDKKCTSYRIYPLGNWQSHTKDFTHTRGRHWKIVEGAPHVDWLIDFFLISSIKIMSCDASQFKRYAGVPCVGCKRPKYFQSSKESNSVFSMHWGIRELLENVCWGVSVWKGSSLPFSRGLKYVT